MRKISAIILTAAAVYIAALISGCTDIPHDLIMPKWDVDLNVPLFNKTYTLNDIIKSDKQDYISVDTNSAGQSIFLFKSGNYSQSVGISNFIKVTKESSSRNNVIPASNLNPAVLFIQFPEGAELDSAEFLSGSFAYNIKNNSAFGVNLTITIPGIIQPGGIPFSYSSYIPGLQTDTVKFEFGGDKYVLPSDQPPVFKNSMELIIQVSSQQPIGTTVTADFYQSDFLFRSVSGYLPTKSLGNKTESFSLNIGDAADYRGKTFLKNASLNLTADYLSPVNNPFDIEVKNLNIIGKRNDGSEITLTDSTGNPNFTFKFQNGRFSRSFTEKNSNITSFIDFLPDNVVLNAEYIMNPDGKGGTATIQDSVRFAAQFSTESYMALKKSTIIDTSEVNFSSNDSSSITDAKSATLTLEINNGIPLTTWIKATVTDEFFRPLFTITNNIDGSDSLYLPGADVDADGNVITPILTKNQISLTEEQFNRLAKAKYMVVSISVRTKDAYINPPPIVALRPDDNISIRAYGGVNYTVNPKN